jgi:hypothetical protein
MIHQELVKWGCHAGSNKRGCCEKMELHFGGLMARRVSIAETKTSDND